jgi:formate dehydrogenase subunit gamma
MTTQLAAPSKYRDWDPDLAREAVQAFTRKPGALIEALHRLQEIFGYLDDEAIILLASMFNLTRAEVHGVASFYHDFKRERPGRYVVKVCQAEACQAMGAEKLTTEIKSHLGIGFHETTGDGEFTLEPVYCLGNCACSPNIMVEKQVYARMNIERFKSLTESLVKETQS